MIEWSQPAGYEYESYADEGWDCCDLERRSSLDRDAEGNVAEQSVLLSAAGLVLAGARLRSATGIGWAPSGPTRPLQQTHRC